MAQSNTASLATAGAAFGPWGAAIGAAVGIVADIAGGGSGPARSGDVDLGGINFGSGPRKLGPLDFIALFGGVFLGIFLFSKLFKK